jgi:modulator of FtsH protease
MALYDRNYSDTVETGYVQEGSSVSFIKQTYQLLAASMIAAAVGAYLTLPFAAVIATPVVKWSLFGFVIFMLWFGLGMTRNKPGLNLAALFVLTFAMGVMLVPMLAMLIGVGKGAIIGNAFLMTAVLFGSLSIFAINSKKDFSSWGKPLFITMIAVFVLSLVNVLVFNSPILSVLISAAVLLLFSIYTIYDTQNLANGAYDSPVDAAVSLFVDFFNMFVSMLHILGIFGSED